MRLYAAYGSNLSLDQMAIRCPDARVVGSGILKGYKLAFNGVATIVPDASGEVPIAVWDITGWCERSLDIYEGFPRLYRKETVEVEVHGEKMRAMVYIMNSGIPSLPTMSYLGTIYDGYNDVGLDLKYLETAIEETKRIVGGVI